jgi:hypothetical protein
MTGILNFPSSPLGQPAAIPPALEAAATALYVALENYGCAVSAPLVSAFQAQYNLAFEPPISENGMYDSPTRAALALVCFDAPKTNLLIAGKTPIAACPYKPPDLLGPIPGVPGLPNLPSIPSVPGLAGPPPTPQKQPGPPSEASMVESGGMALIVILLVGLFAAVLGRGRSSFHY